MEEYKIGKRKIEIVRGNIADYKADAIVIPALPDLEFSGMGVQAAVAINGGIEIFHEAKDLARLYSKKNGKFDVFDLEGDVPLYSAHLTRGGDLPSKHVIHSVALNYSPSKGLYCNKEIIRESSKNVFDLGNKEGLESIGFSALGTGLYRVSVKDSLEATVESFKEHISEDTSLRKLGFVLFGIDSYLEARSYLESSNLS